jgi:hypothetical protein
MWRDSCVLVESQLVTGAGQLREGRVGVLYRWRFFRRCALCRRIGVRGFERIERGWACLDREACAGRRGRRPRLRRVRGYGV